MGIGGGEPALAEDGVYEGAIRCKAEFASMSARC